MFFVPHVQPHVVLVQKDNQQLVYLVELDSTFLDPLVFNAQSIAKLVLQPDVQLVLMDIS